MSTSRVRIPAAVNAACIERATAGQYRRAFSASLCKDYRRNSATMHTIRGYVARPLAAAYDA